MRYSRIAEPMTGGAVGTTVLVSDYFRVVLWELIDNSRRQTTEITCFLLPELNIRFAGSVITITDEVCLEQMTPRELLDLLKALGTERYEEGRADKATEMRKVLGL